MNRTYEASELSEVAQSVVNVLRPGSIVGLSGPLGVGKTALVRAIVSGLGSYNGEVTSPSYVLQNIYENVQLPGGATSHWDLYRLEGGHSPFELFEYFEGITFIEWPEKGCSRLRDLLSLNVNIAFSPRGADFRKFELIETN